MDTGRRDMVKVAEEGTHYEYHSDGRVICRSPGCIEICRDLRRYKAHARGQHELQWPTPRSKCHSSRDPDSENDTPTERRKKRRRKQPGDAHCPQYNQQRGTVEARWNYIRDRKRRIINKKAEEYIRCRESMRPEDPKPTFITLILEKALPKMGHDVWSFLLEESKFKSVYGMLADCTTRTHRIWEMCLDVETELKDTIETEESILLRTAVPILKTMFANGDLGEIFSEKVNLLGHRGLMIKEAQDWMSQKAELLKFEKDFTADSHVIRQSAKDKLEEWEIAHKSISLEKFRKNLESKDAESEGEQWAADGQGVHVNLEHGSSGPSQWLQRDGQGVHVHLEHGSTGPSHWLQSALTYDDIFEQPPQLDATTSYQIRAREGDRLLRSFTEGYGPWESL